jgi:hypothetical protein
MAPPSAIDIEPPITSSTKLGKNVSFKTSTASGLAEPLKYSGSLDQYKSFDTTAVIGREFADVQLTDILNDEQKIRDLAIIGEPIDIILDWKTNILRNSVSARSGLLQESKT